MSERPILMSGPMIRAILAGQKSMTRRTVKGPVTFLGGSGQEADLSCWGWFFDGPDFHGYAVLERGLDGRHDHGNVSIPCPYGEPGDNLWVRETWATIKGNGIRTVYRADGEPVDTLRGTPIPNMRWQPSIFLRRGASRLSLAVTDIRVERVQSISDADVVAEGITAESVAALWAGASRKARKQAWGIDDPPFGSMAPYALWHLAWAIINGAESWFSNPWVWVVGFRRIAPAHEQPKESDNAPAR